MKDFEYIPCRDQSIFTITHIDCACTKYFRCHNFKFNMHFETLSISMC